MLPLGSLQEFERKMHEERHRKTTRKVYIVQFYDAGWTWCVCCRQLTIPRHSLADVGQL